VPAYISAQLLGGTLASGTLKLIFSGNDDQFPGTIPSGSCLQAFALEFIVTFYLMFVISGVATDNRAVKSSNISHMHINTSSIYYVFYSFILFFVDWRVSWNCNWVYIIG
jgi:glycerol uptake facilitator-like aquaporin